jgi:CheY-like chemotaxis protein
MADSSARPEILIVDDDPDQLFLSRRLVEKAAPGFAITTVIGGAPAIAHLTRGCEGTCAIPVLVFLDIKMPEMDGFEVLRWIRGRAEFAPMRVLILSSSDDPNDAKKARELGADGYLIKQPNVAVVASILRQISADGGPRSGQAIGSRGRETADH